MKLTENKIRLLIRQTLKESMMGFQIHVNGMIESYLKDMTASNLLPDDANFIQQMKTETDPELKNEYNEAYEDVFELIKNKFMNIDGDQTAFSTIDEWLSTSPEDRAEIEDYIVATNEDFFGPLDDDVTTGGATRSVARSGSDSLSYITGHAVFTDRSGNVTGEEALVKFGNSPSKTFNIGGSIVIEGDTFKITRMGDGKGHMSADGQSPGPALELRAPNGAIYFYYNQQSGKPALLKSASQTPRPVKQSFRR